MPEWYVHCEAAQYLGVSAPELMNLPTTWRDWAIDALSAKNFAEKELNRRAAEKAKSRRRGK